MRWMFGLDDIDVFYVLYVLDDLDVLDALMARRQNLRASTQERSVWNVT